MNAAKRLYENVMNIIDAIPRKTSETPSAAPAPATSPATPALDALGGLGGDAWKYARPEDDLRVHTLKALAKETAFKVPKDTLERLQELGRLFRDAQGRLREVASQRVGLLLHEQAQLGIKAVAQGRVHEMKPSEHLSKSQLRESLGALKQSVKSGIREITSQGQAIAGPIDAAFRAQAERFIDALEQVEIAECSKFSIPHSPSALINGMRASLTLLGTAGSDPGELLPWAKS
jgi:hypothetical protein